MWEIVEDQARTARERERAWSKLAPVAMVFAFHAMEGYLNYVGERLAPEIWTNEREYFKESGFKGRINKVMEIAGLPWEPGKRPLQTVLQLQKLRNAIAHGKPKKRSVETTHADESDLLNYPVFSLRPMFTPKVKMERAVEDVKKLANEIQRSAWSKHKSEVDDLGFRKEAFPCVESFNIRHTVWLGGTEHKRAEPASPYQYHQEYPKYLYHPQLAPKGQVFQSAEETEGLAEEGWVDTPAKFATI